MLLLPPRAVRTEVRRRCTGSGGTSAVAALLSLVAGVTACAGADGSAAAASGSPNALRLLVRLSPALVAESPDAASIADRASRSAGVPVRHLAATSEAWHALLMQCPPADCEAALRRLAADDAHFESVERDPLRRAAR